MNLQQAEIYARIEALPLDAESASFPAALWIQSRARKPHLRDVAPVLELDPHEIAYLSGGAERAADAVLTSLVHRGAAAMHPSSSWPEYPDHGERPRPPGAGEPPPCLHWARGLSHTIQSTGPRRCERRRAPAAVAELWIKSAWQR